MDKKYDEWPSSQKLKKADDTIAYVWDNLNELMDLCGGIKYGDGFSIDDLYLDTLSEVENVQNYWLNDNYPFAVKNGLVDDVPYKFVGYKDLSSYV